MTSSSIAAVLVLASLPGCGGKVVVDPSDAAPCLVTGPVCDPPPGEELKAP